jgi:hypothetical protein
VAFGRPINFIGAHTSLELQMIYEHTEIYMYSGRNNMSEASKKYIYMHQQRTNPLSLPFE